MTNSWQQWTLTIELDQNWDRQTFITSGVLLASVPDVFSYRVKASFWGLLGLILGNLICWELNFWTYLFWLKIIYQEEPSDGASKAGQVYQQVQACERGLGDLSKPTTLAYFWGVKLTFVIVIFFGCVQLLRFFIVKIFWSCSNLNWGIFIQLCELASNDIHSKN